MTDTPAHEDGSVAVKNNGDDVEQILADENDFLRARPEFS
jgi:hypothetical protein